MYIATAKYWEQPPIETQARVYSTTKTYGSDTPVWMLYQWAKDGTGKHVKLISLTITPDI